jgi:hypothetical protein
MKLDMAVDLFFIVEIVLHFFIGTDIGGKYVDDMKVPAFLPGSPWLVGATGPSNAPASRRAGDRGVLLVEPEPPALRPHHVLPLLLAGVGGAPGIVARTAACPVVTSGLTVAAVCMSIFVARQPQGRTRRKPGCRPRFSPSGLRRGAFARCMGCRRESRLTVICGVCTVWRAAMGRSLHTRHCTRGGRSPPFRAPPPPAPPTHPRMILPLLTESGRHVRSPVTLRPGAGGRRTRGLPPAGVRCVGGARGGAPGGARGAAEPGGLHVGPGPGDTPPLQARPPPQDLPPRQVRPARPQRRPATGPKKQAWQRARFAIAVAGAEAEQMGVERA